MLPVPELHGKGSLRCVFFWVPVLQLQEVLLRFIQGPAFPQLGDKCLCGVAFYACTVIFERIFYSYMADYLHILAITASTVSSILPYVFHNTLKIIFFSGF